MQQATQAIAAYRTLVHFAADNYPAAPGAGWMCLLLGWQQLGQGVQHSEQQRRAVCLAALLIQPIKHPLPLEPMTLGQGQGSNGQACPATTASCANHATAGMAAHAHAEARYALALTACSFQSALSHGWLFAALIASVMGVRANLSGGVGTAGAQCLCRSVVGRIDLDKPAAQVTGHRHVAGSLGQGIELIHTDVERVEDVHVHPDCADI